MKTQPIHGTSLIVSRIAFGCMRLPPAQSDVTRAIRSALDAGINFFDHADVYQRGRAEEAFSAMWSEIPGLRDKIILQSKCGIRFAGDPTPSAPKRYDFSYQHIIEAVNGSLKRLKTDRLDVLLLHRPDPLVEPEQVAQAFSELRAAGKVRFFGVSNHTGAQIDLLKTAVREPLVVNQLEVSALHTTLINAGVITNQDNPPYPVRGEGTLEYCRTHKITVQAWSPLARGLAAGKTVDGAEERVIKTVEVVDAIARERNVSREAVLIAWLLRHPAKMQPIIGTMNPERIKACCQADAIELSSEEWWRLFTAGRGAELP
jgi:predicted oxidoreductase